MLKVSPTKNQCFYGKEDKFKSQYVCSRTYKKQPKTKKHEFYYNYTNRKLYR